MRGHGRLLRGMTPPELAARLLDDEGELQRQVLDERLFGPSLEEEQRKTRLTVQVAVVAAGAVVAIALTLLVAHLLGL